MFHFQRQLPHPSLRAYFRGYWLMKKEGVAEGKSPPLLLIPDGFPELFFRVEGAFAVVQDGAERPLPAGALMGQLSKTIELRASVGSIAFFVKLYPWVPHLLFGFGQKDLLNQNADLSLLDGGNAFRDLGERLRGTGHFGEAVALLDDFFLSRVGLIEQQQPLLETLTRQIFLHRGQLSVDDLRRNIQYSNRYLEQLFSKGLGLSPKRYARVIRNKAITYQMATQPPENLSAFAQEMGYFDQSHFIKDFKSISQLTPSAFLAYMKQFPIREADQYLDQYR